MARQASPHSAASDWWIIGVRANPPSSSRSMGLIGRSLTFSLDMRRKFLRALVDGLRDDQGALAEVQGGLLTLATACCGSLIASAAQFSRMPADPHGRPCDCREPEES